MRVLWLCLVTLVCTAADLPNHPLVAYHDSWNEWPAATAEQTSLANLPEYIDVILLAFARPDAVYRGDLDLSGTGLEYRIQGRVLRDAIGILKQRHAGTRVLLSVGGTVYKHWDQLALSAISAFVHDFRLDGIDIDFEPPNPGCRLAGNGRTTCATDQAWSRIIRQTRAELPRPLLLTASVWSVGAYGEGAFQASRPRSDYTGIMLSLLRSPRAADLDLLSINAYDAGPQFDPLESFRAYRAVWPGLLALGVEVRLASGAGPFHSAAHTEALAREIIKDPRGGMMLYALLTLAEGGQIDSPNGIDLARALCRGMGSTGCNAPR
jgi:chitinase